MTNHKPVTLEEGELKYDQKMFKSMSFFLIQALCQELKYSPKIYKALEFIGDNEDTYKSFDNLVEKYWDPEGAFSLATDLKAFLEHPETYELSPPPKARKQYVIDFADRLGVETKETLAARAGRKDADLDSRIYSSESSKIYSLDDLVIIVPEIERLLTEDDDWRSEGEEGMESYDRDFLEDLLDTYVPMVEEYTNSAKVAGSFDIWDESVPMIGKRISFAIKPSKEDFPEYKVYEYVFTLGEKSQEGVIEYDVGNKDSELPRQIEWVKESLETILSESMWDDIARATESKIFLDKWFDPRNPPSDRLGHYQKRFDGEFMGYENHVILEIYKTNNDFIINNQHVDGIEKIGGFHGRSRIVMFFDNVAGESALGKVYLPEILRTLRHELQHESQDAITISKRLRYRQGGLPGSSNKGDERTSANGSIQWAKPHALRAIEYKPRLSDEIARFNQQVVDRFWSSKTYGGPNSTLTRDIVIRELMTVWVGTKDTMYLRADIPRSVSLAWFFEQLKDNKPSWYKKAVKEFYTGVSTYIRQKQEAEGTTMEESLTNQDGGPIVLNLSTKEVNESFMTMFGTAAKMLLQRMFGAHVPDVKIKGKKSDVSAFADALVKEKQYMETFHAYGLDNPRTYRSKGKLDSAVAKFTRKTGLKWPFK